MGGAHALYGLVAGLLFASVLGAPADLAAATPSAPGAGDSCWAVRIDAGKEAGLEIVAGKSTIIQIERSTEPRCRDRKETDLALASADPAIADVQYIPTKQIYIRGVKPGRTTISILEERRVLGIYDLVVIPDAEGLRRDGESLKKKILELYADESDVKVTQDKDFLTISGHASSPTRQTKILQLAEAYSPGKVVNLLEVKSKANIAEGVQKAFEREDQLKVWEEQDYLVLSGCVATEEVHDRVLEYLEIYGIRDVQSKNYIDPKDREGEEAKGSSLNLTTGDTTRETDIKWRAQRQLKDLLTVCGKSGGSAKQVMLEVRIAEMSRDDARKFGINLNFLNGARGGITMLDRLVAPDGTVSPEVNAIYRFVENGNNWTLFIDALKSNGIVNVLAEPNLIAMSGETAKFNAGGEFPYETTGANGTTGIAWKEFGVTLEFKPTVLDATRIGLVVHPTVSQIGDFIPVAGKLTPKLLKREVNTTIELADGQSFAIAGLLQQDIRDAVNKFPVLGDIPILGALFRSSRFQKNETELIVIATPHLVKPLNAAEQPLPTDSYVEPNDFEFYLKGSLEGKAAGAAPGRARARGGLEGDFGHIVPE